MFDIPGTRCFVTSDHALCEQAQGTGICSASASLHNKNAQVSTNEENTGVILQNDDSKHRGNTP